MEKLYPEVNQTEVERTLVVLGSNLEYKFSKKGKERITIPHGILFTYDQEEKKYEHKPMLFKDIKSGQFFSPKLIFSTCFRKSSQVQNSTKRVKQILELRLFLLTLGITQFSNRKRVNILRQSIMFGDCDENF